MAISANFERAFFDVLGNEGTYSNNPNDPGGETMWGITRRVAQLAGYDDSMRDMPKEEAQRIYATAYWHPNFDNLPYGIAFQLFDAAVNNGLGTTIKLLQKVLKCNVDGIFGPNTLAAARAMPELKLIILFDATRLEYFASLDGWDDFGKGWARRIASNLRKGVE